MDSTKLILFCVIGVCSLMPSAVSGSPGPILLFPGVAGSQLDGKTGSTTLLTLVSNTVKGQKCLTEKYKKIWFDLVRTQWCAKDLKLSYDKSTNTYRNMSGVDIKAPGFGDTDTVEYSLRFGDFKKEYMKSFVDYFTKMKCKYYKSGVSIRAAPYDWRLAADELDRTGYFNRVKGLIEEMYEVKKRKVSLVGHSMGGLVTHYFLTSYSGVDKAWKKKYIKAWITLGTPWAGSVKALQILLTTKETAPPKCRLLSEGALYLPRLLFKDTFDKCEWWSELVPFGNTFESSVWLLPKPSVWGNDIIVKTNYKKKSYKAKDYKKLFKRSGYKNGYKMFEGVQKIDSTKYPGVPTYCFYGKDKKTPKTLSYKYKKIEFWKEALKMDPIKYKKPKISYGDGDGTVNFKSLHTCVDQWKGEQNFESKEFSKVGHTTIVQKKKVLKEIAAIVGAEDC